MAQDRIPQVNYVLIYPAVIVWNIICTIRQALTKFTKPSIYGE